MALAASLHLSEVKVPSLHPRYRVSSVLRTPPPSVQTGPGPYGLAVWFPAAGRKPVWAESPLLRLNRCRTCCHHYPGGTDGYSSLCHPSAAAFPGFLAGRLPPRHFEACSVFTRVTTPRTTDPLEGTFSGRTSAPFVTSWAAPGASGWSGRRQPGFSPGDQDTCSGRRDRELGRGGKSLKCACKRGFSRRGGRIGDLRAQNGSRTTAVQDLTEFAARVRNSQQRRGVRQSSGALELDFRTG
jgi:hypothetical protein